MTATDLDQPQQDFLAALIQAAKGDPGTSVDMYKIGTSLGLDKEETRRMGEELIGRWLVEIKSLSGAVGVTEEGFKTAAELGLSGAETPSGPGQVLKTEPVAGTDLELSPPGPSGCGHAQGADGPPFGPNRRGRPGPGDQVRVDLRPVLPHLPAWLAQAQGRGGQGGPPLPGQAPGPGPGGRGRKEGGSGLDLPIGLRSRFLRLPSGPVSTVYS